MTTKELKAQNFLTQCKLDDALAEIKELTALVEHMEKEKHNGIEIVAEPCPCTLGLFRIAEGGPLDMMYLHTKAVEYLKKERGVVYETDHIDENDLDRDIGGLAARIESMESDIREETEDAWGELVELYHDRIDPSRRDDGGLIPSTLQCCHCYKTFLRNSEEHDNVTISEDGELIYCMDCREHCDDC